MYSLWPRIAIPSDSVAGIEQPFSQMSAEKESAHRAIPATTARTVSTRFRESRPCPEHSRPTARSDSHEFVQLRRGHTAVEEAELSLVSYFVCGVQKAGHGRAHKGRLRD